MKFSLEISIRADIKTIPKVKDIYITQLPGEDYKDVSRKVAELVKEGFNPVPHFSARSIKNHWVII